MKPATTIQLLFVISLLTNTIINAMDKQLALSADLNGNTPLHLAASKPNQEMIAALLFQESDMTKLNNFMRRSLETAIESGHTANVVTLLNYPNNKVVATYEGTLNAIAYGGDTCLHTLIISEAKSDLDRFKIRMGLMLKANPSININAQNNMGYTPLHLAIIHNATAKIIKFLRTKGADLSKRDFVEGRTPLNWAFYKCCTDEQIKALLDSEDEQTEQTIQ